MNEPVEVPPETAPEQAPQALDLAMLRNKLQLPESATEQDIIAALLNVLAAQQAEFESMSQTAATAEDNLTNRVMEAYKDVIPEAETDLWRELILNRGDEAIVLLNRLSAQPAPATSPAKPEPTPAPLKNRLADKPRTAEEITVGGDQQGKEKAQLLSNRAHEIRRTKNVPFAQAWEMASREIK